MVVRATVKVDVPPDVSVHKINKVKKSQLRNIIKESIKELMTEQFGQNCSTIDPSNFGATTNWQSNWTQGNFGCHAFEICYQYPPTHPQAGQWVTLANGNTGIGLAYYQNNGGTFRNNNDFYQWLGSPSVGSHVYIEDASWPTNPAKLKYVGIQSTALAVNNIIGFGTSGPWTSYPISDCSEGPDYGYKCESIWYIQTGKRDKNIGNQCIPGTAQNPGTHLTMQDCESNCDLQYIDGKTKTITPFTTDPQSMTKPKDDLVVVWPGKSDMKDRLQELANIK